MSDCRSGLGRIPGAHIPAAAEDEAGQEPLCGGVCDWSGASDRLPSRRLGGGPGGGTEDRHLQPQTARLCLLGPQQRLLVIGQHGEEHRLHAAGPGGGQNLR